MRLITPVRAFFRAHRWKIVIAAIVLLPIVGIAWYAFTPRAPSYVTEEAERGDLRQIVDAIGTVISERDLQLQFPVSGIVSAVYVREGDAVRPGQRLAALRAGNLAAEVNAAAARLQAAQADLRAREEGSRPEDVAIAEAEVESRRASLLAARTALQNAQDALQQSEAKIETLRAEAQTALAGQVVAAGSTVSGEVTDALNALSSIRDTLRKTEITDAVIRQENSEYQFLLTNLNEAEAQLQSALALPMPASYADALVQLDRGRAAVSGAASAANRAFALLNSLNVTSYLTESLRETHKAAVATDRSTLQTSLSTLDAAAKTLQDASASYDTRIAAEQANIVSARGAVERAQADIVTYEASLRIAEAQLQLRRSPARQTDIDAARAAVRQMAASLQRAQADLGNTVLTAPIAGRITQVNVKEGEALPAGAAVTLLGESPYRIEMYVSEIDIPKVQVSQSGSVKLDAFNDTRFALRVTGIDDAPTNRDGVNKYRVRLDFVYPHDELKIGMTGDVEIVTGGVDDVVTVPVRAVLEREDGSQYVRVLREGGTVEERTVETGLEGEGSRVAVTDVREGETIIVLERD